MFKIFTRQAEPIAVDPDVNRYYSALINEAGSEYERIELGRAATSTMRARAAAGGVDVHGGVRRLAALIAG